jgi:hypothetical protein
MTMVRRSGRIPTRDAPYPNTAAVTVSATPLRYERTADGSGGLRLVALAILQTHPLKVNIPSSQRDFAVQ